MKQYRGALWGLLLLNLNVLSLPVLLASTSSHAQTVSRNCDGQRPVGGHRTTAAPAGLSSFPGTNPPEPQPATVRIGHNVSIGYGVRVEGQVVTKKPGLPLQGPGSPVVPVPEGVSTGSIAALYPDGCKTQPIALPQTDRPQRPSPVALATGNIAQRAKQVTVRLGNGITEGSGVIIERQGNTYTLLTAAHVVAATDSPYQITTDDQQQHTALQVRPLKDIDLAVVTFQSSRTYSVCSFANGQTASEGLPVFVAGFPMTTAAITEPVYNFTDGKITARSSRSFADGYAMVYTNRTLPGMSGGGVFNRNGELVGIHGRGDVDSALEASTINTDIRIKTGFNLGIPIESFLKQAQSLGMTFKAHLPANAPPPSPVDDALINAAIKAQSGDYAGARAVLSQAISTSPRAARLYLARANYAIASGQSQAALQDLDRVIEFDPQAEQAYWLRGAYRNASRDAAGAISDFSRVIELNPNRLQAYLWRATLYMAQTDYQSAIQDYSAIIRLDPKNVLAFSQRGSTRFIQGDQQGALKDYDQLIKLNPKNVEAYDRRAHVRRYSGNPQGALQDYRMITKINPRNSRAYEQIASLSEDQNDIEGAIAAYGQLQSLKPNDTSVYLSRGQLYEKQERYVEAIADYTKLIKLQPFQAAWFITRGSAREKAGQIAGAKADYRQVAKLYQQQGDPSSAKDWLERANKL
ncbi:trypsin-like peptidase domain-containing protein [Acaryochloris sp. IP29b_bin.148]|uniref:tetratricopeptide repeat protein n=1 Tax=Acaryochloris sp. IP29b_bin.148 TaxID=2969218 RepID=UPI002613A759|nr:trypsin-like peptidase domain-containing protein [Acaryochloris sp. IP29b_bin.148]